MRMANERLQALGQIKQALPRNSLQMQCAHEDPTAQFEFQVSGFFFFELVTPGLRPGGILGWSVFSELGSDLIHNLLEPTLSWSRGIPVGLRMRSDSPRCHV